MCWRKAAGAKSRTVLCWSASVAGTILRSCRTGRSIPATCAAARYDAHKGSLACIYDNRARRARASGLKRDPTWHAVTELNHSPTCQLETRPSDTSDADPTWQTGTAGSAEQAMQSDVTCRDRTEAPAGVTELKHKATWQLTTSSSDASEADPTWQTGQLLQLSQRGELEQYE